MWRVYRTAVYLQPGQVYSRVIGHFYVGTGEKIPRSRSTPIDEIKKWLHEHTKGGWRYRSSPSSILFKDPAVALHFKMRWHEGR